MAEIPPTNSATVATTALALIRASAWEWTFRPVVGQVRKALIGHLPTGRRRPRSCRP